MNRAICEDLANAIILQAVKDYRDALRTLKKYPNNSEALTTKNDCERFFRSFWYNTLTSVDGSLLIQKLSEEVQGV